ncbi:hypothetical protein BCR44DRAFT_1038887 [Catenaria anguillulae PL171]|uniref:Uncharacterized protein n=1 Tax=Catenaria anguillulae PL171 TaxID=765915 RepID=A0A1Y2H5L7_9FUNG|nr:hypothetical protein BCR44DRAFT_1038887 [Catenaria anguillulae PL171]
MQRFRAKNHGPWSHKTNYGLDGLSYPQISLRPAFLRPAFSAPGVGDPLPADSHKSHLFELTGSSRLGPKFSKPLTGLAVIVVRPHPDESYCLYQPVAGKDVDRAQANPAVERRMEWKYIVSVYLRLDSVASGLACKNQQSIHELLALFPTTRHAAFDKDTDANKLNLSSDPVLCADSSQFVRQVDQIMTRGRVQHVPVLDRHLRGRPRREGVVQLGPGGPFYDPVSGLFSAKYGPLDPQARLAGFLSSQLQPRPNGSGFVINLVRDVTTRRTIQLANVITLISTFPLLSAHPIPPPGTLEYPLVRR